MKFSELPAASSRQNSPGLCTVVNDRGKFKQYHSQTLNWIGHSCTYGLYPLSITLEMSDLQIFRYFEQWMFAFRKGLIVCMGIWVIEVERKIMKGSCL